MQQKHHVVFVDGPMYFLDIQEDKNGYDSALTSTAQAEDLRSKRVNVCSPVL
jgi:hypothetical protein